MFNLYAYFAGENTYFALLKHNSIKAFFAILLVFALCSCKVFKKPCGCNDFGTIELEQDSTQAKAKTYAVAP
jgi:hypothetical protein